MKHVLVISFSDLAKDPRVRRQISFLSGPYRVTAAGLADPSLPGVDFIRLPGVTRGVYPAVVRRMSLALRRYNGYQAARHDLSAAVDQLRRLRFDVVVANDVDALPLAFMVRGSAKVVADLHEYAPREFEDRFSWRLLYMPYKEYLCRAYLPRCDAAMTVCDGIAGEYLDNFGIQCEVVTNAAPYVEIAPSPAKEEKIRLIHHGGAIPSRRIELMIRMMAFLDDRFSLTLMLVPNDRAYYDSLVRLAEGHSRVVFREPVPLAEIVPLINGYDVGVYILEPNSFNNKHALPNKFFEFIQARLAVAIGPSPEMARIVRKCDCGIVADDFAPQTLAARLNALTAERLDYHKNQAGRAAFELSAEGNRAKVLTLVSCLLEESGKGETNPCAE